MPINEQLQFKLDRSVGNLERCFYATASLSLRVAVAVAVGVVVFWTNVDFFVVILLYSSWVACGPASRFDGTASAMSAPTTPRTRQGVHGSADCLLLLLLLLLAAYNAFHQAVRQAVRHWGRQQLPGLRHTLDFVPLRLYVTLLRSLGPASRDT